MSITVIKEAWRDYRKVVKSDYKNEKIRNFRYNIEQVIIPTLKEINIDVDIASANTMSDGEVVYEAIADGNLITISFISNSAEGDNTQLYAEVYTMTGKVPVGVLSMNNMNEVQTLFLDAMEEAGLDVTDEPTEQDKKEERLRKELQQKQQKPVNKEVKRTPSQDEIPLPPEEPEDVEEEKVGKPLLEVYPRAIEAYIKSGRINNQMIIQVEKTSSPGQFTFITCYYIDRTRCLVQSSPLNLDQVTNYQTLGKYLVDLWDIYHTTLITVQNGNGDTVFEEEISDEIGGEE